MYYSPFDFDGWLVVRFLNIIIQQAELQHQHHQQQKHEIRWNFIPREKKI